MKQCNLTKGLVVFLTIMITLFCGVMPSAWAGCDYCDDQEFTGCYGFSDDGTMLMRIVDRDGNPVDDKYGNPVFTKVPKAMTSVGVFCLLDDGEKDGMGTITGHEVMNFGGLPFNAELKGRYEVESDCTGTAWICVTPEGAPAIESEVSFVITGRNFDEIQMVTTKMMYCVNNVNSDNVVAAIPLQIFGIAKKICE